MAVACNLLLDICSYIFCVGYYIYKKPKAFAKGLYKLPIHLAAALLIFTFFATGYFGAASKTPKIEK